MIDQTTCINTGVIPNPYLCCNQVDTEQNGCRTRIMAFDRAIMVNDTSDMAVNRDYTAVDGLD